MDKYDIILVRPYYSDVYSYYSGKKLLEKRQINPPLGLLYLAAALERSKFKVKIIDAEADQLSIEEVAEMIVQADPVACGMSATTPEYYNAHKTFEKLKMRAPSIMTVLGGAHASVLAEDILRENPSIDFIVRKEGEATIVELMAMIKKQTDNYDYVAGLSFRRKSGEIVCNPDRDLIEDLDLIPFPAHHLVNYAKYLYPMGRMGMQPIATILTSRGCPNNCIFCYHMFKKGIRYRSAVNVLEEIQLLINKHGVRQFLFADDTFTLNIKRAEKILDGIINKKLNIKFKCMSRADSLNEDILKKMKRAGVERISIGVESGNQKILDLIKKGTRLEQYRQVYDWMAKLGIETRGSFILGHPYETWETASDTIWFAKQLNLFHAAFNIATPYPGTELFTMAMQRKGLYLIKDNWKEFKRWGQAVVRTDELSPEDLIFLQNLALKSFFSQPKIIWYYCKQIFVRLFNLKQHYYYFRPFVSAMVNLVKLPRTNIINFKDPIHTISPGHLCSPSRYMGEVALLQVVKKYVPDDNRRVLDVGCGTGEYRFLFRGNNYLGLDIKDYDFSSKVESSVRFVQANAARIPVESGTIDFALCQFAMEYFTDSQRAISEIGRALKPGGVLYVCVPTMLVQIYVLPLHIIRLLGFWKKDIYLSGAGKETFYSPKKLEKLYAEHGFKRLACLSTCGPGCFLLKISYLLLHGFKALLLTVMVKLLNIIRKKYDRPVLDQFIAWCIAHKNVLKARGVAGARSWPEYQSLRIRLELSANLLDILYINLLKLMVFLDKTVFSFIKFEFGMVLEKE